jgi:hypothetical protein
MHCNISLESAHELYQSLCHNNILDLHIDGNPIPDMLRLYPRRYRHNGICHALTSSFEVADKSMRESHLWRSERLADIKATKFTQAIIKGRASSGKLNENVNDNSSITIDSNDYDQIDLLSASTGHVEKSKQKDKNKSSKSINIEKNQDAAAAADDDDNVTNTRMIILDVYYGRRTELLGNIVVDSSTTYPKAKELIAPLIQAYVKSIGDMHTAEFLVSNFQVLDNKGELVTGPRAEVRTIGMEAKVNDYKVIVRPATWLTMDNS